MHLILNLKEEYNTYHPHHGANYHSKLHHSHPWVSMETELPRGVVVWLVYNRWLSMRFKGPSLKCA